MSIDAAATPPAIISGLPPVFYLPPPSLIPRGTRSIAAVLGMTQDWLSMRCAYCLGPLGTPFSAQIKERIFNQSFKQSLICGAEIEVPTEDDGAALLSRLSRSGFEEVILNGQRQEISRLPTPLAAEKLVVIVDEFTPNKEQSGRLGEALASVIELKADALVLITPALDNQIFQIRLGPECTYCCRPWSQGDSPERLSLGTAVSHDITRNNGSTWPKLVFEFMKVSRLADLPLSCSTSILDTQQWTGLQIIRSIVQASQPQLLALDTPSTSMSAEQLSVFSKLITELNNLGFTIVIADDSPTLPSTALISLKSAAPEPTTITKSVGKPNTLAVRINAATEGNLLAVLGGLTLVTAPLSLVAQVIDDLAERYPATTMSFRPGRGASTPKLPRIVRVAPPKGEHNVLSTVATYSSIFESIRDWYALLPGAKAAGLTKRDFSFVPSSRTRTGACRLCRGSGLSPEGSPCFGCHGGRYREEVLKVKYRGFTIAQALDLTIAEAHEFFVEIPRVRRRLSSLVSMGVLHPKLNQRSANLSGGEMVRVSIAAALPDDLEHRLIVGVSMLELCNLEDINLLSSQLAMLIPPTSSVVFFQETSRGASSSIHTQQIYEMSPGRYRVGMATDMS